jgi:AcrR family transcriptional regulator
MVSSPSARGYHHGDLAPALIDAAVVVLAERGIAGLSLREVARRAGVSHGAPAHHFKDKAGLLTAVAGEGFRRFGDALRRAAAEAGDDALAAFAATGRAYVRFAVEHRPYFEIMFRPEHINADDHALREASDASYSVLLEGVVRAQRAGFAPGRDPRDIALSAWAKVHGLATLWNDGNLQARVGMSLDETIERVLLAP